MYFQDLRTLPNRTIRMLSQRGFSVLFCFVLAALLLSGLIIGTVHGALLNVNVLRYPPQTIGQANQDALVGLTVDGSGHAVATGYFHGSNTSFGGTILASAQKDAFVFQTENSTGNVLWAKSMGGSDVDEGRGIAVDSGNNVFVTGNFRQMATFGTENKSSAGDDDIFVTKLDSSGAFQWTWTGGGSGVDSGWAVAADSASNAYVTGWFSGTIDFGSATITSISNDVFVVGINSDGSFKWANYVAGLSGDRGNGIAVDSNLGLVYVTGYIQNDADFNPTGTGTAQNINPSARDIFLSKYDSSTGAHIETISFGGNNDRDFGTAVTVDEATGFVYVTGAFDGTADFDPSSGGTLVAQGTSDVFVAVYDSSFQHQWSVGFGGPGEDVGEAIALGSNGNVYVSGRFEATADFDPSVATSFERTSAGDEDVFVVTLNSSGEFVSVATVGGSLEDRGLGVGVDGDQNIFYGGYFAGTANLDPTGTLPPVSSAGNNDIFISALSGGFAPTAVGQALTTPEDTAVEITLSGSDAVGGAVTFSLGSGPANGTLSDFSSSSGVTTSVIFTPALNFNGQDSFTFFVTDSSNVMASAVVSITVSPVNDPPVADDAHSYVANEDEALFVPPPGLLGGATTDVEGDSLTASAESGTSSKGVVVAVQPDGSFTYDPTASPLVQALKSGESMTDTFEFSVTDSEGATDEATVSLEVEGRNDAPVAVDDGGDSGFSTTQDTVLMGTTSVLENDTDVEGESLRVETTPVSGPQSGSLVLREDGTFEYTPDPTFTGTDGFQYRVVDESGGTDVGQVTIEVLPVNSSAPTAEDGSAQVDEDSVLEGSTLLALAMHPTDAPLAISSTPLAEPSHGTLLIRADGTFRYEPEADFHGSDGFQFQVCEVDTPTSCASAIMTITVSPVNDAPVANDDVAESNGELVLIDVLANDSSLPDTDEDLTIVAVGTPDPGGLAAITAEGQISYLPPAGFEGTSVFTYTVSDRPDESGLEATATVTVNVRKDPGGTSGETTIYFPYLQVR